LIVRSLEDARQEPNVPSFRTLVRTVVTWSAGARRAQQAYRKRLWLVAGVRPVPGEPPVTRFP
jgi:hypothetical protein